MDNCTVGCGFSQGNPTAIEQINRVHEIMSPMVDSGLPIQSIQPKNGYGLLPFMFEIAYDEGNAYLKLKNGIINGDTFIEVKVDPTDGAAVWYENGTASSETVTTEELAIDELDLTVEDVSILGNLTDQHTIVLTSGAQTFIGRVDSVNALTNTITLQAGPSVAIPAGTCVSRGTYHRPQDCVTASNNEGTMGYDKGKYKSYFRKIEATVKFDSNTDVSLSGYTFSDDIGLDTAKEWLKAKKFAAINELNRQLNYAMFFDANYAKGSNPAFPNSSETMGILPRLDLVEASTGIVTTFDFNGDGQTGCCISEDTCGSVSNSIQTFFDYLDMVTKSGFYNSKVIIGVNESQIVALRKMRPYFESETGYVITAQPSGSDIFISRELYTLSTGAYTVEFRYEPTFDKFKIPFMLVMPEDSVYFTQKVSQTAEFNGTERVAKKYATTNLLPGMPIFRVVDTTIATSNLIDPCKTYHIDAEIGIVRPFTDKGAYMRFWNFGSCLNASCATCVSDSQSNPGTGKVQMIAESTS